MRRKIQVRGVMLKNGLEFTEELDGVVSVYVHPDGTVTYKNVKGEEILVAGNWTSYTPRVL